MDGEKVEKEKCDMRIEGMTCGACVEVSVPDVTLHAQLTSH